MTPTPVESPTPKPTPNPATAAREHALYLYPDLGKKDSTFNRAFIELYKQQMEQEPDSLRSMEWPLLLARRVAAMLNVKEYTPKEVAAVVVPTATPTWFEMKQKDVNNSLEKGAYNEKRSIYPYGGSGTYYYYGPYGRYYVDQKGIRRYDSRARPGSSPP